MNKKTEDLIEKLYKKLQNYKIRKLILKKDDFKKFIFFLFKNN